MSGDIAIYTIIGLIAVVIVQTIGNVIVQRNLTHSIDRLSDKVMARDYRDYKGAESIKEDDVSPAKDDDDPKSWYDH